MSGLLRVEGLVKYFPIRSGISGKVVGWVKAVDGVDLAVPMNSVVALVGESGWVNQQLLGAYLGFINLRQVGYSSWVRK